MSGNYRALSRALPVVLGLLSACGGDPAIVEETPPPDETSGGETKPWAEMNMDERRAFMASDVLPVMATLFEEFDSERFAGFDCAGCHGSDMQERNFAMPNPAIMPLHPTGTPEQLQMVEEQREMVTFMFQRVMPRMQELLGAEPYDATTGGGFSCYACHTRAGDDASVEL